MDYEFHVGDYAEAVGGLVGYVAKVQPINEGLYVFSVKYKDHNEYKEYNLYYDELQRFFNRIGAYDFTKKEKKKKKIETMPCVTSTIDYGSNSWIVDKVIESRNKINELVDAVNKLRSDYDEHIKAHRQTDR